jgi:hypothetical protein
MFLQLIIVFAFSNVFLHLLLIIIITFIVLLLLLLIIIVSLFCVLIMVRHIFCFNYNCYLLHLDCGCYLLHPNYSCHLFHLNCHHHLFYFLLWLLPSFVLLQLLLIIIITFSYVPNHGQCFFLRSYNCYQSCLLPFFVHTIPHCAHDHSNHFFCASILDHGSHLLLCFWSCSSPSSS